MDIAKPGAAPPGGILSRIDNFLAGEGALPSHTVAETIFPGWLYKKHGRRGVFEIYPDVEYPTIKTGRPGAWGTYAHRLVRRMDGNGKTVNPLEDMLEKMQTEIATDAPKRSCYEIGISHGEFELPLYSTVGDRTRHMGGPCLSHLSFKMYNSCVHLTAIYRSHDYSQKVIGNILGLARLLDFVAKETSLKVGTLVIHSTYAFLNGSKTKLRLLLSEIQSLQRRKQ
ncbi:MAG: hypothetical protein OXI79_00280 [Gammaproteobacteria bacterium]|nr:hypothetical protein [Gammaproteobacteria bacterium]